MVVSSERVEVAPGVFLRVLVRPGTSDRSVLLVHGLASNARLWDGVGERLARAGITSVAVDQRGHGESDSPQDGYDFATLADDLGAVMGAHGGEWVAVGQSWGGNVVLEAATRRPDSIVAAVLVDGGFIRLADEFPDVDEALARLRPPDLVGVDRTELEREVRMRLADFPEEGIAGQLANFEEMGDGRLRPRLRLDRHLAIVRHLHAHDPDTLAAKIDVPVVVVAVGEPAARPRVGSFAGRLRHGEVVWMDGHHDIHAQRPDEVSEVIRRLV